MVVAPFVKLVLGNFQPLMKAHHLLLNLALCFSIIPSLRAKFPRFARDHLLESNFMATLSLDLLPIYLNFAVKGSLLHYTCLLLAAAVVALSVYSSLNVRRPPPPSASRRCTISTTMCRRPSPPSFPFVGWHLKTPPAALVRICCTLRAGSCVASTAMRLPSSSAGARAVVSHASSPAPLPSITERVCGTLWP